MADRASPAALGFSMPAEWEPHAATWMGWPHNASDWPGKLAVIHWVYGEIVRKLAPGETVRIVVQSGEHERQARRVLERTGVDRARLEFLRLPTNRGWTRDFGPMFVRRVRPPAEVAIVRFRFNAWAKYPDWKKDDQVPERVARRRKLRLFPAQCAGRDVVLEGGSIDVNGRGTLLTTEECLLDREVQARNPGLSRADLEAALRDSLGVTNVLWLGKGIAGDDTHGHVDDLCRFVDPRTVVLCREHDPEDANHRPLEENRERLAGMRLEDGSEIEVVDVQMAPPPSVAAGRISTASPSDRASEIIPTSAGDGTSPSVWIVKMLKATAVARIAGDTTLTMVELIGPVETNISTSAATIAAQ